MGAYGLACRGGKEAAPVIVVLVSDGIVVEGGGQKEVFFGSRKHGGHIVCTEAKGLKRRIRRWRPSVAHHSISATAPNTMWRLER
jgi:hypothetical protein